MFTIEEMEFYEQEQKKTPRDKKFDKIFNNDFNDSNLEFDQLTSFKIDPTYTSQTIQSSYNSFDYNRKKDLVEEMEKMIENSQWSMYLGVRKKFPKNKLSEVFIFVKTPLLEKKYTYVEIFDGVTNVLDVSYESMYPVLSVSDKEMILNELDKNLGIFQTKKINRIF